MGSVPNVSNGNRLGLQVRLWHSSYNKIFGKSLVRRSSTPIGVPNPVYSHMDVLSSIALVIPSTGWYSPQASAVLSLFLLLPGTSPVYALLSNVPMMLASPPPCNGRHVSVQPPYLNISYRKLHNFWRVCCCPDRNLWAGPTISDHKVTHENPRCGGS